MHRTISSLMVAALVAAGACSRNSNKPADTTLNTDLSLAAQQRGATPLDSVSAAERANALAGTNANVAALPTRTTTASSNEVSHPRHHVSHVSSSAGTVTTTTSSSGTVEKHTKRDAAIGAAAGAVLGATTSRSKVKGGLIGAAVGGLLGGVIGNNVDKKKKP
ncbi:MAG TPA: glycine zipper domain-containing protein [Gemmatimonadaceae bacterium]